MTNSNTALIWEVFRENPASEDLYLPETHIVFLPTGAGAASGNSVRDFFKTGGYSHPKKLDVEEKVIHRTVGESSAVDEVEVTVKFVSGAGGWLLPGIEPHHLEDLTITFPMVISASIAEDRIASVRYIWDNACVLKLVKLIGSRHSWPIVTEAQVEGLRNPSQFRLNPFGNATGAAGARPQGISKIFGSPPISPPQQNVNKKGHPALTSTVFGHLKNSNDDLHRATSHLPLSPSTSDESIASKSSQQPTKKGHPALTSTLFNHLDKTNPNQHDNQDSSRRTVVSSTTTTTSTTRNEDPAVPTKKGHPALTSTLFSHLKEQPQSTTTTTTTTTTRLTRQEEQEEQQRIQQELEERGAGWRPDYVKPKGHPALTSSIFSKATAPSAPAPTRAVRQEQQEPHHVPESERGAGWRADYVKPKGHPALTSSIFSQKSTSVPAPAAPVRQFKKTSHNIFGAPQSTKTSQTTVEQVEETEVQYTLEPSAIETELESNEVEEEINEVEEEANEIEEEANELEENSQESEELESQQAEELARQLKQVELEKSTVNNAPLSPLSPAQSPPQSSKRVHPNYRTTFTIG